jgi:predicted metal-dependent peptidase
MTDKITRCRARLMRSDVGIASILLPLELIESDQHDTMATDGKSIYYNPKFVDEHTDEEIEGVLIHEGCHVIWEHPLRKKNRNHALWNVACDYVINAYLTYDLGMDLPTGGLLDKKYHRMSAEQVYHILDNDEEALQEAKDQMAEANDSDDDQQQDQGQSGGGSDEQEDESQQQQSTGKYSSDEDQKSPSSKYDDLAPSIGEVIEPTDDEGKPLSADALDQLSNAIRKQVVLGDKLSSLDGNKSATEGRVGEMRSASVDWKNHLRDCLESVVAKDYSWSRLNKRHAWRGVNLPSKVRSADGGEIAIAIDTSGSVSQAELDYMASETQQMMLDCGIDKVRVCYCDHVVRKNSDDEWWDKFDLTMGDEIQFKFRGGGGTRFDPVFNLLNEYTDDAEDIRALIYFTDGWGYADADSEPNIPVFWGLTDSWLAKDEDRCREYMPFGEYIGVDCSDAY